MSSKRKSAERRKAHDIRCEVKKSYENDIMELRRKVASYSVIIKRQEEEIKRLKMELYRYQHMHNSPTSSTDAAMRILMSGFGGYSKVLSEYMNEVLSPDEHPEKDDSPE